MNDQIKKLAGFPNENLSKKLTELLVGSCNCNTKTPRVETHAFSCKYRLTSEVVEILDEQNKFKNKPLPEGEIRVGLLSSIQDPTEKEASAFEEGVRFAEYCFRGVGSEAGVLKAKLERTLYDAQKAADLFEVVLKDHAKLKAFNQEAVELMEDLIKDSSGEDGMNMKYYEKKFQDLLSKKD